jgi:large subunit ribosomal protein L5
MARLKTKYIEHVSPALATEFGISNNMALPRIQKIVLNVGTGKNFRDAKNFEKVQQALTTIAGQYAVGVKTKKSVAQFKTRQGMTVALKVTLRGDKMYEFLDRLISVALPRTRDFQGVSWEKIDEQGNINFGIPEHMIFPELSNEELELNFGLQVNLTVLNSDKLKTEKLLRELGFPLTVKKS